MTTDSGWQHRVEVLSTILLACAAVATAWSTYQSAQWRGEQAVDSTRATAARIQSSEASTHAGQLTQVDIATFVQWVDASVAGNTPLAQFYRARFRDEFKPAFAAWIATHPRTNPSAPKTPFAMPQYRLAASGQSSKLNAAGAAYSAKAGQANRRADNYMLAVVLFATALFFAGVSTKLGSLRQREVILGFGWAVFAATLLWIASSPITFST